MNDDPSIIKGYTIKVVHFNPHLGIKVTLEEGASNVLESESKLRV